MVPIQNDMIHRWCIVSSTFGGGRISLIGCLSVDKNRMDIFVTSSWVVKLFMDSESVPSSWERKTMVERIQASVVWNLGM